MLLARIEGLKRTGAEYLASLKYTQLQARNLSGIYTAVDGFLSETIRFFVKFYIKFNRA